MPPCFSLSRIASSTAHSSCGLTVNERCRASIALVELMRSGPGRVHADQDRRRERRLRVQTTNDLGRSMRLGLHPFVVGVEERGRSGHRHLDRVQLVHVHDGKVVVDDGVLRRKVGHEQELAHRRAGPGSGDI